MGSYRPISSIAIIGAGPSGLAVAKYLVAERAFDRIDIFEQRHTVGGVWNYSQAGRSKKIPIPQTNPTYPIESGTDDFESPLYDSLETNIPNRLMQYADKAFPSDSPLFPKHAMVLKYLQEYAEDVKHLIQFQTQVLDVAIQQDEPGERWSVTTEDLRSARTATSTYDAVVVASGHYTVPHIPAIPGLDAWSAAYPGTVIHSKAYRNPSTFTDKNVLVIGNSASGIDIGHQIASVSKVPLLLSSRSASELSQGLYSWKEDVGEVIEFLSPTTHSRAIRMASGQILEDIEAVVFATGYFYSYPFLSSLKPPIITDGLRSREVYKHLFNIQHSTLAFPVLNLRIIPFPMAENQGAVIARIWSGRLSLPSQDVMREWEEKTIQQRGDGKAFHLLRHPLDGEYINELYVWAASAKEAEGLENEGKGKMGTFWGKQQFWLRGQFPAIKKAYAEKGERRVDVRTVEELGFDFQE